MRIALLAVCAVGAALAVASLPAGGTVRPVSAAYRLQEPALEVVRLAGDSLVARHRKMPQGGWAWRSSIQAPHYQTDRDVGAASVGEGLLAAYAVTHNHRYLRAATQAGDYLLGVAEPTEGGLRWPDWADANGRRSTTHYTSFDDGAAGISDFLWKLSEATGKTRFRTGAVGGMRWVVAQAKGPGCPETRCSWNWTDDPDWERAYNGVGMGQAGIVLTLDAFADRTGDPAFRAHARAGAAQLRALTANGARPLPRSNDDASAESGYLSGSAGAALMFLDRYERDRQPEDLATARALLRWAGDQPVTDSGFELGAAGIAWVNARAARVTGEPWHTEEARRGAVWLRHAAHSPGTWTERPGDRSSPRHVGLDSGSAGIGWTLYDLAGDGIDPLANRTAATAALARIRAQAGRDHHGALWYESRDERGRHYRAEPSWHWGAAGIAAFAARLAGWSGGTPGGQPMALP